MKTEKIFKCPICRLSKPLREGRPEQFISGPAGELIKEKHPDWDSDHILCQLCLRDFRQEYPASAITKQIGEVSGVEQTCSTALRSMKFQ